MSDPRSPLKILAPWLRSADHDGVELAFPLPPTQERLTVLAGFLLAAAVPFTLVALGLPGAWLVEWSGRWLVNEAVLVRRWFGWGVVVALALFAIWLPLRPAGVRVRVDRHRLVLRRSLRRAVELRIADFAAVELDVDGTLVLFGRSSRRERRRTKVGRFVLGPDDRRLPAMPISPGASHALGELVEAHLRSEGEGDASAVPLELWRVGGRVEA